MSDHATSVLPSEGACDDLGLMPTKRRNRKPETRAFLRRALGEGLHPFDLPHGWRGQPPRRYKTIAAALQLHLDRREWPGNDQQANPVAVLRRVRQHVRDECRDAPEPRGTTFGGVLERLDIVLDPDRDSGRTTWNSDERRCAVSPEARALLDELWANPAIAPFIASACRQLEDEYDGKPIASSHPGAPKHQAATKQLRKEIGTGERLPDRLRDLVRNARERGDLPRRSVLIDAKPPARR